MVRGRTIVWVGMAVAAAVAVAAVVVSRTILPTVAVPILMYHHISNDVDDKWTITPKEFDEELTRLEALGAHTIVTEDLINYRTKGAPLPPRPIMITLDDGYESVLTNAEPILARHGFKAISYLVTDCIGSNEYDRRRLEEKSCLIWPEVNALQQRATIVFGGHSRHHLHLDGDAQKAAQEAQGCFADLRAHSVNLPYSFAYPFGSYNFATKLAVKDAGFSLAVTADHRVARVGPRISIFELPRLWVTSTAAFPIELIEQQLGRSSRLESISLPSIASLLFSSAIILLLAAAWLMPGFSIRFYSWLEQLAKKKWAVLSVIVLGSGAVTGMELLQHYTFNTSTYDLRLHEDIIRNTLLGRPMYSAILNRSFIGVHASFIFALLAPLYALWQDPRWLLLIQGGSIALGGWLLWQFARSLDLSAAITLAVVISFFFYRGMVSSVLAGFHQEVLAVCFLIGLFWSLEVRRWGWMVLFTVLACACREDVALSLAVFGALTALRRRERTAGLLLFGAAAIWSVAMIFFVVPKFAVFGLTDNLARWAEFGSTVGQIAVGMASHPLIVLSALLRPSVVKLFLPLIFLPLLDLRAMLPIAFPLALCALSSFEEQNLFQGAYSALFIAYLFTGTVRALSWLSSRKAFADSRIALTIVLILIGQNVRQLPLPPNFNGVTEAHRAINALLPALKAHRVLAQGTILPHLDWPKEIQMLGSPGAAGYDHFDYILLSEEQNPWPIEQQEIREIKFQLSRSKEWERLDRGQITVFHQIGESKNRSPTEPRKPHLG